MDYSTDDIWKLFSPDGILVFKKSGKTRRLIKLRLMKDGSGFKWKSFWFISKKLFFKDMIDIQIDRNILIIYYMNKGLQKQFEVIFPNGYQAKLIHHVLSNLITNDQV